MTTKSTESTHSPAFAPRFRPAMTAIGLTAMVVALAAGCETAAKSPADQAAFMERTRCGPDVDENAIAPILDGKAVLDVAPMYSTFEANKSGEQSQLRGARLNVSALPGITAEWLDRALECHGAKLALGHAVALPDDPFWLPGATVDIDVRSAKDGFAVGIAGYSASDAHRILERAEAFAKEKGAARPN
jgi:hypothetical protein